MRDQFSEFMKCRFIAWMFLSVAVTILTAHAIIPHHHHQDFAETNFFGKNEMASEHHPAKENHHHDSGSGDIMLMPRINLPVNGNKNIINKGNSIDYLSFGNSLLLCNYSDNSIHSQYGIPLPDWENIACPTCLLNPSAGFRAPPSV